MDGVYSIDINQIYIEIICNLIRKQNIKLLEKIGEKELLPIRELLTRYVISKSDVREILSNLENT
tara:strand:- start:1030 stop:1224 length:195 start_codon:yes stop_codon:yes gene_type:complete